MVTLIVHQNTSHSSNPSDANSVGVVGSKPPGLEAVDCAQEVSDLGFTCRT